MLLRKQILYFFYSLCIGVISFAIFVFLFPFPQENKTAIYAKFVPWVAARTSLYTPYKYWWPLMLVWIPGITWIVWYWLCYRRHVPLLQKSFWLNRRENLPAISVYEVAGMMALLLFLVINFSYSSFYQFFYNYHHLNFIAGPIHDVIAGKYLLINTKAQYGFSNILLASYIFKHILYFSHANIHYLSMIMGFLEYICVYLIVRILTRNTVVSMAGLCFLIAIHFYGVFGFLFPSELYVWPGGSVWRFFPAMPTALLVLLWLQTNKKIWFLFSQLSVVNAVLWNIESGVPLLGAYCAILVLQWWFSSGTWISRTIALGARLLSLMAIALVSVVSYSLYTWIQIRELPQWSTLTYFTVLFNSGFLQNRSGVPAIGLHYWPVLMYGISIFLTMVRKYAKVGIPVKELVFLTFLSVYGFGTYRYYIGKQSSSDLAAVILPAGIIFIYMFYYVLQQALLTQTKKIYVVTAIIMFGFLVLQHVRFVYWTGKLFGARFREFKTITTDPNVNHPSRNRIIAIENTVVNTIPWTEVMNTIQKIEKYVPADKPIAILGYFDHILLMQSGRTNVADYWDIHATIYTYEEMETVIQRYKKQRYLFVDKRLFRHNPVDYVTAEFPVGEQVMLEIFIRMRNEYEFVEDIGMLYVYKRK